MATPNPAAVRAYIQSTHLSLNNRPFLGSPFILYVRSQGDNPTFVSREELLYHLSRQLLNSNPPFRLHTVILDSDQEEAQEVNSDLGYRLPRQYQEWVNNVEGAVPALWLYNPRPSGSNSQDDVLTICTDRGAIWGLRIRSLFATPTTVNPTFTLNPPTFVSQPTTLNPPSVLNQPTTLNLPSILIPSTTVNPPPSNGSSRSSETNTEHSPDSTTITQPPPQAAAHVPSSVDLTAGPQRNSLQPNASRASGNNVSTGSPSPRRMSTSQVPRISTSGLPEEEREPTNRMLGTPSSLSPQPRQSQTNTDTASNGGEVEASRKRKRPSSVQSTELSSPGEGSSNRFFGSESARRSQRTGHSTAPPTASTSTLNTPTTPRQGLAPLGSVISAVRDSTPPAQSPAEPTFFFPQADRQLKRRRN